MSSKEGDKIPMYWPILSDTDKESYSRMRIAFLSPACKHRRHHSTEINMEIVNTIKNYVARQDPDDWKRALVCGICWLPNAIAINTRQLRLLLSKCKSSINALFQNMGYVTMPTTSDYAGSLSKYFPILRDNYAELRKWTIRLKNPVNQLPNSIEPIIDSSIADSIIPPTPLPSISNVVSSTEETQGTNYMQVSDLSMINKEEAHPV